MQRFCIALLAAAIVVLGPRGPARALAQGGAGAEQASRERSPISRAPSLRVTSELAWEDVHAGDPLRIVVRLSSPRAEAAAERQRRRAERGEKAETAESSAPAVAASDLAPTTTFKLFRLRRDGARERVLEKEDWSRFQVRRAAVDASPAPVLALRSLREEWMVPPDLMGALGTGHYVLDVAWEGKGLVDASHLDGEGKLTAEPLVFEIIALTDAGQRAVHEERVAHFEYTQGRYKEALAHARASLSIDPATFTPERLDTYLLVADAAFNLGDMPAAIAAYRSLLKRLPPPIRSDLAHAIEARIKLLEALQR